MMNPDDRRYTEQHEWIQVAPGTEARRVGITDFAQRALGDVVFVQLPDPGTPLTVGECLGEVESTKSVSEIYAPVSGTVVAANDSLQDHPELVNTDPFGRGWLVEIRPDPDGVDDGRLLSAAAYAAMTDRP